MAISPVLSLLNALAHGARAVCLAATVMVLVWGSPSAWAAPDEATLTAPASNASSSGIDPIASLLIDRGLLPPSAQQAVRRVSDTASELVLSAMNFLGVRYRRGGSSVDDGFDCSGFTRHVFEHSVGLLLPRRADEQARLAGLLPVSSDELKPGDLVFFNTMRRTFSHVGIYVGEGKFIHAPKPGAAVRIEDMRQSYWTQRYTGARRAPMDDDRMLTELRKAVSAIRGEER